MMQHIDLAKKVGQNKRKYMEEYIRSTEEKLQEVLLYGRSSSV